MVFVPAQNSGIMPALLDALRSEEALSLNLHERPELAGSPANIGYLAFYDQGNILISRKLLQPALQKALHNM